MVRSVERALGTAANRQLEKGVRSLVKAIDGFEAKAKAKVDLGRGAPSVSDLSYVFSLYHDLLGREPDPAGLAGHLAGLRNGMSREQVKQAFLDSPEYAEKHATTPAPTPAPAPAPAPTARKMTGDFAADFPELPNLNRNSPVEQLKQVIDADAWATQGHGASQADYDYWLSKMQGDNDSGFVTSGQMSAMEYWHRRALGWQAGGADKPPYGPYSDDPSKAPPAGSTPAPAPAPAPAPTPAPSSPVPGVPWGRDLNGDPAHDFPELSNLTRYSPVEQLRFVVTADVWATRGEAPTDADFNYWVGLMQGDNDSGLVTSGRMGAIEYWHRRLLGWQAGGSDAPKYGPYSADPSVPAPHP